MNMRSPRHETCKDYLNSADYCGDVRGCHSRRIEKSTGKNGQYLTRPLVAQERRASIILEDAPVEGIGILQQDYRA